MKLRIFLKEKMFLEVDRDFFLIRDIITGSILNLLLQFNNILNLIHI